ncbi:MAG: OadG family protein [Sphaerochaetaceae bacterium]|nr:OadG family protein [Sphaerochaetaceae bacterium]
MVPLMTNAELVSQVGDGFILLVLGMGTVFVFLTILIFATTAMSKIVAKIAPAKAPAPVKKSAPKAAAAGAQDAEVAAAIAAAYARNRN